MKLDWRSLACCNILYDSSVILAVEENATNLDIGVSVKVHKQSNAHAEKS